MDAHLHAQLGRLKRQRQNPTIGTGNSFLSPQGAPVASMPQQAFYCVRIYLLPGDPNSNGGLDSNGYYVCYQEDDTFPPSLTTSAPTMRLAPDTLKFTPNNGKGPYVDGSRVYAYAYGITSGAATSTDNGLTLLRPIPQPPKNTLFTIQPTVSGSYLAWANGGFTTPYTGPFVNSGSVGGFSTSDDINFIVPDNGLYLAIATVAFQITTSGNATLSISIGSAPAMGTMQVAGLTSTVCLTVMGMFIGQQGQSLHTPVTVTSAAASYGQFTAIGF